MIDWLINFVNTYVVDFVIDLVFAVIIVVVGFALVSFFMKRMQKSKGFKKLDVNIQTFLSNFVGIFLKIIIVLTAIIVLGIPQASIVALIGSCGLAIGLALQGGLSNVAGGIIIMFCKPFHVGDYIDCGSTQGVVTDIGIYYTMVTTPDNRSVAVPNASLANATIQNYSAYDVRRIDFDFKVSYKSDIDLTRKVLLATSAMNDLILKDPGPEVFVAEHGDSSITIKLRIWTKAGDYWSVYFDMWEDVKKAFDKFGIEIPYNHLNVIVDNKN